MPDAFMISEYVNDLIVRPALIFLNDVTHIQRDKRPKLVKYQN